MLSHFSCVQIFCDAMDCSSPSSSVPGESPGNNTRWNCPALLQGIFPTQYGTHVSYVSSTGIQVLYHWYHLRSPASNCKASNTWLFNSRALALQWLLHGPRNSFPCLFIYASLGFSPSLGVDWKPGEKQDNKRAHQGWERAYPIIQSTKHTTGMTKSKAPGIPMGSHTG